MLISNYYNINRPILQPAVQKLAGFSGRQLTSKHLDIIKTKLENTDFDPNVPPCGEIRIKNKTGKEELLSVQKQDTKNSPVKTFCIRKTDKNKTLLGYIEYFISKDKNRLKDLHGVQYEKNSGIEGIYMISSGQEKYNGLGKKLFQLMVETSILEGCPGKFFGESEMILNDLSPTGFHYKCGMAPYKEKNGKFVRDKEKEEEIKESVWKNNGYTPIDNIHIFLSPEGFKEWEEEIHKNPILKETRHRLGIR